MKSILIVDDDSLTRIVLTELFWSEGYEVVAADGGQSAVRKMAAGYTPDIIILDVNMPTGNGFDVLSYLRSCERTATTPVVLLTGSSDDEVAVAASYGFQVYIRKPFDIADIIKAVTDLLH